LIDSEEQQRRQQLVAEVDINTAQIEEREQGMRELESQMYVTTRGVPASIQSLKPQPSPPSHIPSHTLHRTEVNEIFKDIANIVQEQGDMLDSIEGNLTTTYDRVDSGVTQLTHASRYQVRPTDAGALSTRHPPLASLLPSRIVHRFPHITFFHRPFPCLRFAEKGAQQGHVSPGHCRHCRRNPRCRVGDQPA
jgi:hypothetical protein